MLKLRRLILATAVAAIAGIGAAGISAAWAQQQQPTLQKIASESVIEQIKSRGTLRVAQGVFVPWAMPSKEGKLIGFEVDVATKLAADMGVELELVPTAWDGIIPALLAGKFDFIIGGMTVTAKRALTVNFSNPYDYTETLAVVNKKLRPDITTAAQLNSPDITFVTRRGATSGITVSSAFPKAKEVAFDDENAMQQEFVSGNVTALLPTSPTPSIIESRFPDVTRVLHEPLAKAGSGIGLRKGDPDALAFLNAWVLINTNNHWLEERHRYWFDGRSWATLIDGGK